MTATPHRWLHWLLLVAGFALLAFLFFQLGPSLILERLGAVGWRFPVIVALFGAHECVRAVALGRCLIREHRPPVRRLLWLQFGSEAVRTVTQTGPFGGEPVRAWMLRREGVGGERAYAATISEVLANSWSSAVVTTAVIGYAVAAGWPGGLLAVFAWTVLVANVAYVLTVAVSVARRTYVIGWVLRKVGRLPVVGHRLSTDAAKVRRMENALLHALRDDPLVLLQVMLLQVVGQSLLVVEAWVTINALGLPLSLGGALLVEAYVKVINAIQLAGANEGGYTFIFTELGMPATVGFSMSFLQRIRSLALVGLVLLVWMRFKGERFSRIASQAAAAASDEPC